MRVNKNKRGFTVVELLLVIVVIGVLAAIVTATYTGTSRRSKVAVVQDTLRSASKTMEIFNIQNRHYPSSLPDTFEASNSVNIEVIQTPPYYSGLSPVQASVLFHQVCQDLINEGLGRGKNMGGSVDDYITGCHVYNRNQIQVHGWTSTNFNTNLTEAALTSHIASVPSGGAWHPNQQSTIQTFYTELKNRYLMQGGAYPITTFWDAWANTTNGGVMHENLPAPDGMAKRDFCLQAVHKTDNTTIWHTTHSGRLTEGAC